MSIYPSLEDMQVDRMLQAQCNSALSQSKLGGNAEAAFSEPAQASGIGDSSLVYPDLADFMGLQLSRQMRWSNTLPFAYNDRNLQQAADCRSVPIVAPLSGAALAVPHAQVTNSVRELIMCKGADGKVGLRVKDISKGCFVSVVVRDSPAAAAGLRFGDQLLQVQGTYVAGFSVDRVHELLRRAPADRIALVVRDRPFERTFALHRDSLGRLGFQMDGVGRVKAIVKDSSAARNGMLTEHHVLEVNGRNVVGMTEKERLHTIEAAAGGVVTVTVVPSFIYEHMVNKCVVAIFYYCSYSYYHYHLHTGCRRRSCVALWITLRTCRCLSWADNALLCHPVLLHKYCLRIRTLFTHMHIQRQLSVAAGYSFGAIYVCELTHFTSIDFTLNCYSRS